VNATSPAERQGVRLDGPLSAAAGGDEVAFLDVLDACDGQLRRLAVAMLGDPAGQQLMPEMWRTALERWPADRVADHEAVRAWLCTIVVELARARGVVVDGRLVGCLCIPPERFLPVGHRWAGHWVVPPEPWQVDASSPYVAAVVRSTLNSLPSIGARAVTILHDVDGFPGPVVAQILGIDDADERRLLHAGRTAAREALEHALASA
jgi:DNA-directed RNA polymerase specialized sigma24 family protein